MKLGFLHFETSAAMTIVVCFAGLLFWFLLAFISPKSATRRRAILRQLATGLAIFSLIAILLRPSRLANVEATHALLITPGAGKASLKALPDSIAFEPVLILRGASRPARFPEAQFIPDVAFINRQFPEIRQLTIAGHGLKSFELAQFDNTDISLYPAPVEPGIAGIDWPRKCMLGQSVRIRGALAGFAKKQGWLQLADLSGLIDSLRFEPDNDSIFTLSATPPAAGNWHYRIRFVSDGADTLFAEKISFAVREPERVRILVLEGAPRFETRFLKEMLARAGHAIAIKTAVSREIYRTEFFNMAETDLADLREAVLQKFDVLIIDGTSLQSLASREQRSIARAISEAGLGVLLLPDEAALEMLNRDDKPDILADISLQDIEGLEQRTATPHLLQNGARLPKTSVLAMALEESSALQPLIRDGQNRTLAAVGPVKWGKVGFTLIEESYRWVLEGNAAAHADYWACLLSELASKSTETQTVALPEPPIHFVDEPLAIRLYSPHLPIAVVQSASSPPDSLRFRQDRIEPQLWHTTFWPLEAGWHTLTSRSGATATFYVSPKLRWQSWQQTDKIASTQKYGQRQAVIADGQARTSRHQPMPLIYFFLLFLASCAYLWAERRF